MLNIDRYSEAIQDTWTHLILNTLPLFVYGIILLVICVISLIRHYLKKSFSFFGLILSVVALTYAIAEIAVFSYDIRSANFGIYNGTFEYNEISGRQENVFKIAEDPNLHIRSVTNLGIHDGVYSGYLLYTKNSHWVIAYSTNPFP